jgi:flavin-dependent dehydrogenase
MRVAVVGAGPAGALTAWHLARAGWSVDVFDPSHPREKPCGGGLTAKALALLPEAPASDPLPARRVGRCELESGSGERVEVALARPVAIAARRDLDLWLLRRATGAGARHLAERVIGLEPGGRLSLASGERRYDVVVGADGANSLVRRRHLGTLPAARRMLAAGWLARGDAPMLVRFTPDLEGYLWLFPRRDHVCVGICAPLERTPGRALLERLEAEVARSFPALSDPEAARYAHTIPSPSTRSESLREIAGDDWALVGDAAALADPITGEGIHPALASAEALARTLIAGEGPRGYPPRLLAGCGDGLLRAARLRGRFYAPGFARRMIRYAALSAGVRAVLGELMLGDQGYRGLRRRLLAVAPRLVWDGLRRALRAA